MTENNRLYIIIILLMIMVLCMGTYIAYNSYIDMKNNFVEDNNKNNYNPKEEDNKYVEDENKKTNSEEETFTDRLNRDTFVNLAKIYINTVTNAIVSDEIVCEGTNALNTNVGTYYLKIDSNTKQTINLIENGKSPWNENDVKGYVKWVKTSSNNGGYRNTYSILLMDTELHGINKETVEDSITRTSVLTNGKTSTITVASNIPQEPSDILKTECTLK